MTTVSSADYNFIPPVGGGPDLNFALIGSAVPEPPTWAMLIAGSAGLASSFAAARRSGRRRPEGHLFPFRQAG
jgi:PEP-CTERM motif